MIFFGALVFGMGVCYFWPTMLGFVAENLPKTGAVGLNLMGGAGMFAVSVYMMFMGGFYDRKRFSKTPGRRQSWTNIRSAAPGTEMANAYASARSAAGPEILNATLIIPIILTVAFAGLYFYMRGRSETRPCCTCH